MSEMKFVSPVHHWGHGDFGDLTCSFVGNIYQIVGPVATGRAGTAHWSGTPWIIRPFL